MTYQIFAEQMIDDQMIAHCYHLLMTSTEDDARQHWCDRLKYYIDKSKEQKCLKPA